MLRMSLSQRVVQRGMHLKGLAPHSPLWSAEVPTYARACVKVLCPRCPCRWRLPYYADANVWSMPVHNAYLSTPTRFFRCGTWLGQPVRPDPAFFYSYCLGYKT